jgi:hypothetical protein
MRPEHILLVHQAMRVIGYVRVSTDEQAANGVSLAAQTEKVRGYCALYDLDLVDLIDDPGASAKTLELAAQHPASVRHPHQSNRPGLALSFRHGTTIAACTPARQIARRRGESSRTY